MSRRSLRSLPPIDYSQMGQSPSYHHHSRRSASHSPQPPPSSSSQSQPRSSAYYTSEAPTRSLSQSQASQTFQAQQQQSSRQQTVKAVSTHVDTPIVNTNTRTRAAAQRNTRRKKTIERALSFSEEAANNARGENAEDEEEGEGVIEEEDEVSEEIESPIKHVRIIDADKEENGNEGRQNEYTPNERVHVFSFNYPEASPPLQSSPSASLSDEEDNDEGISTSEYESDGIMEPGSAQKAFNFRSRYSGAVPNQHVKFEDKQDQIEDTSDVHQEGAIATTSKLENGVSEAPAIPSMTFIFLLILLLFFIGLASYSLFPLYYPLIQSVFLNTEPSLAPLADFSTSFPHIDSQPTLRTLSNEDRDAILNEIRGLTTTLVKASVASAGSTNQNIEQKVIEKARDLWHKDIQEMLADISKRISDAQLAQSATVTLSSNERESLLQESRATLLSELENFEKRARYSLKNEDRESILIEARDSILAILDKTEKVTEFSISPNDRISMINEARESLLEELNNRIASILDSKFSVTLSDEERASLIDEAKASLLTEVNNRIAAITPAEPITNTVTVQGLSDDDRASLINEAKESLLTELNNRIADIIPPEPITNTVTAGLSDADRLSILQDAKATLTQELGDWKRPLDTTIQNLFTLVHEIADSKQKISEEDRKLLIEDASASVMKEFNELKRMYEETVQFTQSSAGEKQISSPSGSSEVTKEDLERLITELRDLWKLDMDDALEAFDADRTGLVDYAVKSAGGSVVAASPTLVACNLWPFLCSLLIPAKKPDEMLTQLMGVGNCWPMQGQHGQALIKLREPIYVNGVTLQHVSSAIAPDTTTTPKEFSIWAVLDEQVEAVVNEIAVESSTGHPPITSKATEHGHHYETGVLTAGTTGSMLGRYTYVNGSRAIQYFNIADAHQTPISHVRFILHSNYGNPNYTCVYRLRVHGRPARQIQP